MYDAIIVGGGPAGLSAALVLGRCRRRVLVCDDGHPRNAASRAMHGYLSRDGLDPADLLRIGREEVRRYDVELRARRVTDARCLEPGFEVTCDDGARLASRTLLLATGVVDAVPAIDGIDALYGRSVFHCPYCDGWEVRDRPLAAYGKGKDGVALALGLLTWSRDVVLCTDGGPSLPGPFLARLERYGIELRASPIARLEGRDGILERIVFADGETLARRAMFFHTGEGQRSDLAARLGCAFTPSGDIETGTRGATSVPGLYAAGDATREVQFAIVAAAEGAAAAYAINRALQSEEIE